MMNRAIRVIFILLLLYTPKVFAQEQAFNISANTTDQQIFNLVDDPQDEQINQDEGYGVDDQEYYEAEGLNAEGMVNEK